MFMRNRAVQMTFVKPADGTTPEQTESSMMANVEAVAAYADIFKDVVTHTALTVGGVFAACKIVERICK